jgi:diadenosine tetraphosphate (Ap4A) HIT family hydrolase
MTDCPMCTKWNSEPELQIAELRHCYVTLNSDQFFPGYCFIFTKNHVCELFHLDAAVRSGVIEEVNLVATALYDAFRPTKMNYELLGNMVPHMHWHIVPRFNTETLWPRPIWSEPHEPFYLADKEYSERISVIRNCIIP